MKTRPESVGFLPHSPTALKSIQRGTKPHSCFWGQHSGAHQVANYKFTERSQSNLSYQTADLIAVITCTNKHGLEGSSLLTTKCGIPVRKSGKSENSS